MVAIKQTVYTLERLPMLFGKTIIGLDRCEVLSQFRKPNSLHAHALLHGERLCRFGCGNTCRIKETKSRQVRHGEFARLPLFIYITFRKLYCSRCQRSFHEEIPGVRKFQRSSECYREDIFQQHEAGASLRTLARSKRLSPTTVSSWVEYELDARIKETATRRKVIPKVFGIDEHFFTRKEGFATTIVDLNKNQIFDVVLGRSDKALEDYFLRLEGREQVEFVVMDLAEVYRSIVQKYFPNAQIIADRFHVVRNVFHLFQKVWHQLDGSVKWKRGLGKLFRMHAWNLSDDQTAKLNSYLALNPVIEAVYAKRNEICRLLIRKNQRGFQMRKNVGKLLGIISELKESGFGPLRTLADTLESWAAEIGRMWTSSKSNGPVEGFHNKMEVISRRAYGYRNFKNYRRRVLAMSGWDGVLSRRTVAFTKMPWMRT
jgi:transposase